MTEAEKEAERIFNLHYTNIFQYGEEMSEEIVISILAKNSAIIHVNGIIKSKPTDKTHVFLSDADCSRKFYREVKTILENK